MKAGCLILTAVIVVAIMAVCLMVKFATEIQVEDKLREENPGPTIVRFAKPMGVISLQGGNSSLALSDRFPFVAAVTRNDSNTWAFACFASVILVRWIITSAHCRRHGSSHRVLVYHDFIRNFTHTYPILFWRVHENYNNTTIPKHDLALGKMNIVGNVPTSMRSAFFDEGRVMEGEASVWKTVATMDKKLYLTNDFARFEVRFAPEKRCFEVYGIYIDESLICVEMSKYDDDCFVHDFGPIFFRDKLVGLITIRPKDCDVKLAIATNISYYSKWIHKSTAISRP